MANKILVAANGTPIVFADSVNYPGDGGDGGARTHQINMKSLAAAAARQSDKADIDTGGVTNRFPQTFTMTIRWHWTIGTAPTAGGTVDCYWAPSVSGTAGTANPGGVSGSDGNYTGTAGSSLAESLKLLQFLGSLIVTLDEDGDYEQQSHIVILPTQYGSLVVVNNTDSAPEVGGEVLSVTFTPREYEVQ